MKGISLTVIFHFTPPPTPPTPPPLPFLISMLKAVVYLTYRLPINLLLEYIFLNSYPTTHRLNWSGSLRSHWVHCHPCPWCNVSYATVRMHSVWDLLKLNWAKTFFLSNAITWVKYLTPDDSKCCIMNKKFLRFICLQFRSLFNTPCKRRIKNNIK